MIREVSSLSLTISTSAEQLESGLLVLILMFIWVSGAGGHLVFGKQRIPLIRLYIPFESRVLVAGVLRCDLFSND